jgi:hypothetical protein
MNKCALTRAEREALFSEVPEEGRRRAMDEHLDKCPECRAEAEAVERLLKETEAVRAEIRQAASAVDWEALPARIADLALAGVPRRRPAPSAGSPRSWGLFLQLRPALAGVLGGLIVGAAAMYFVLKAPGGRPDAESAYHASREFLDRAELEMARRSTLDYLEKSQYMLLDAFGSGEEGPVVPAAVRSEQARDLLQRKKYLNDQLDRFQMAKAKAICDQIEVLFQELTQISEELSAAELARIKHLVEERQILLKINLVKKELQSGV